MDSGLHDDCLQDDDGRDRRGASTTIVACDGGPLLVRGPIDLFHSDGSPIPVRRSTVALCRCGRSSITPMCDGSHKLGRETTRPGRSAR
ncbi:CDGSH iron-sulfur domain-containing protein [Gordonia sp. DT101]|uniref:CDGSH iron-sulfur domain-containing protein n=1 Tax=Gordonia sp. DT101 TaxID=3416545 RepID=UPI003CE7B1AF